MCPAAQSCALRLYVCKMRFFSVARRSKEGLVGFRKPKHTQKKEAHTISLIYICIYNSFGLNAAPEPRTRPIDLVRVSWCWCTYMENVCVVAIWTGNIVPIICEDNGVAQRPRNSKRGGPNVRTINWCLRQPNLNFTPSFYTIYIRKPLPFPWLACTEMGYVKPTPHHDEYNLARS